MNICPKCQGRMEVGFIADHGYGHVVQSEWLGGSPEKGWLGSLKLGGKRKIRVAVERCTACGYLESYAKA